LPKKCADNIMANILETIKIDKSMQKGQLTFKQIHNITLPYLMKGDEEYLTKIYIEIFLRSFNMTALILDIQSSSWYKNGDSEIWWN